MADVTLLSNPMTTAGDSIVGGASGAPTRVGIGTAGQVWTVNSGATAGEWADSTGGTSRPNLFIGTAPYYAANSTTSYAGGANRAFFVRFICDTAITVTTAYFYVGTQAGNIDIGIYNADLSSKLGSTGSFACPASGTRSQALSAGVALSAGTIYYAGVTGDNASMKLATASPTVNITTGWNQVGLVASGAFPLPATPSPTWEGSGTVPVIFFA